MAGSWGYGLKGLASGLSSGFAMGLEKSKINALKTEQKRLEQEKKDAQTIWTNWYTNPETKEFLTNLDTASQGERSYFISGLLNISKDLFNYFIEIDNDIREGDMESAKDKNDLVIEKIKSMTDLAEIGMKATFPDGTPMKISDEDLEYQKKIQMGKMAGGKTGEAMGREMWGERFGELPITPEPEKLLEIDKKLKRWDMLHDTKSITDDIWLNGTMNIIGAEKTSANKEKLRILEEQNATTDQILSAFGVKTPPTPVEGEITAGEKRAWDMSSSVLFGSSDWVTGISKPGIISMAISNKLHMGQPLTEEENAEVRSNYNAIKDTIPDEIRTVIESQLKRYGISLEAPITPEPTITPEPEPKKWWEFWKSGEKTTPIAPQTIPKTEEIPPMKVPTESKEAMIPLMSKKELEDAIKGLDPSDPIYKLIYDEAVKRGYITK